MQAEVRSQIVLEMFKRISQVSQYTASSQEIGKIINMLSQDLNEIEDKLIYLFIALLHGRSLYSVHRKIGLAGSPLSPDHPDRGPHSGRHRQDEQQHSARTQRQKRSKDQADHPGNRRNLLHQAVWLVVGLQEHHSEDSGKISGEVFEASLWKGLGKGFAGFFVPDFGIRVSRGGALRQLGDPDHSHHLLHLGDHPYAAILHALLRNHHWLLLRPHRHFREILQHRQHQRAQNDENRLRPAKTTAKVRSNRQ